MTAKLEFIIGTELISEAAGRNTLMKEVSPRLNQLLLPSQALVRVNRVNDQRGRETERVAQWEDKVWLSFEPSAAILLKD